MTSYDIAVIGIGMIGSAALRGLAEEASGLQVVGVGPGEPTEWGSYDGPFASHYDHARITRVTDPDRTWATLARRSIDAYPAIAEQSGIAFHHQSGHLRLGRGAYDPSLAAAERIGHELGAPVERLNTAALTARFPTLHFSGDVEGLLELGGAGWINPRALVAAQLAAATAHGAAIVRDTATRLQRIDDGFAITTRSGAVLTVARVILSADGHTGALLSPLLDQELRLECQGHTTVLAELRPEEATEFAHLPSLIWPLADHKVLPSVYTTPPARYPDGRWYLKIGGPLHEPLHLETLEQVRDWFQSPGNPTEIAALQEVLRDLHPRLEVVGWSSKPCMNSYTAHGYPYIDQIDTGLFVCTGGCGAAAKSSDAIGRLGARMALHGTWDDALPVETFRAVFC